MKKVIIVNKFGPVSNAITGQSAKELADFLSDKNIEITFICLRAGYKNAINAGSHNGGNCRIKELKTFYHGDSALLRMFNSLIDGLRMWIASLTRKCDAIIVMTDPPLLFFWFQLFRSFSKRKLLYWTMDLYPEAFVAGKFTKSSNVLYRFLHRIVYKRPPDLMIALGEKQLEYLNASFKRAIPNVIIPCGLVETKNLPLSDYNKNNNKKITFGYGGNIGEAHDAEFLISLIRQLDPEKHEMVISLYGSKADHVKQHIRDSKAVKFRDFLSTSDIAAIDINVATLLPQWHHICVPSKAVTAICCGSSLLLNATREADNWNMFKDGSWLIESGKDYTVEIRRYLSKISREAIDIKKSKTRDLAEIQLNKKKEAFNSVASMAQNL